MNDDDFMQVLLTCSLMAILLFSCLAITAYSVGLI